MSLLKLLSFAPKEEDYQHQLGEISAHLQNMVEHVQQKYPFLSSRPVIFGDFDDRWHLLSVEGDLEQSDTALSHYIAIVGIGVPLQDKSRYETFEEYFFESSWSVVSPGSKEARSRNNGDMKKLSHEFAGQVGLPVEHYRFPYRPYYSVIGEKTLFSSLPHAIAYLKQNLRAYLECGMQPLIVQPQSAATQSL